MVPKGFHETFVTIVFLVQMHFCEISRPRQVFMVQILGSITFQRPVLRESNHLAKGLKVSYSQQTSRCALIISWCLWNTHDQIDWTTVQTTDE